MKNLRQKTVRSGFAKLLGQIVNFSLRVAFLMVMARLLNPEDFGLAAMVTVITGFYGMFTTAGLSSATIQKSTISDEQISTLFWLNMILGILLACFCLVTAPVLATFYGEPRLFWITVVAASGLVFSAASVQHSAILQRQLRFVALAAIESFSQFGGIVIGITMGIFGFGYWALVVSAILQPAMFTVCVWGISGWIPGRPRRRIGMRPLLRFGGIVTLNDLAVYIAYNADKMLLGRFWGADILGLYGRAYALVSIPTHTLNAAVGGVTFAALSRLQHDPTRLNSYFLRAYRLANSLTLPTTLFCTLFADDIVLVALGPKWHDAASIFRLLSPTVLVFGIINPLGWFLLATGLQVRSLNIALVIVPLVIVAYLIGLPYGSDGVALGFSTAMTLFLAPCVIWCLHGTTISPLAILLATSKPLLSALFAAAIAIGAQTYVAELQSPYLRLGLEGGIMIIVYLGTFLFILGEKDLYVDLLRSLREPS